MVNFRTFTGEIGELDHSLNGYTPALLSFFLVYNLNGEVMGKRINYINGQKVGYCYYLYDVPTTKRQRRAVFKCKCGNEFESLIGHVRGGATRSCGCLRKELGAAKKYSNHPLYLRWKAMNIRCYYKDGPQYHNYGGRGIKVCDEWKNDFKAYSRDVMSLPGYDINLTLDRIDNDGDYEPGNLRWATITAQNINQRLRKDNKSGYKGIYLCSRNGKWTAQLSGKFIGYFDTKEAAIYARDKYISNNQLTEYELQ